MSLGKVDIWNVALTRIGQPPVQKEDEDSNEAKVLRVTWPLDVLDLQSRFYWDFNKAVGDLVPITDEDELVESWRYAYEMPDTIAFRYLVRPIRGEVVGSAPLPYSRQLTNDMLREKILTDLGDEACGAWSVEIEDTRRWPAPFVTAMVWRCMASIAMTITRSEQSNEIALNYMAMADATARAHAGTGRVPRERQNPDSLRARGFNQHRYPYDVTHDSRIDV